MALFKVKVTKKKVVKKLNIDFMSGILPCFKQMPL